MSTPPDVSSGTYLERARQRANGDTVIKPGTRPSPNDLVAELDRYFKSAAFPWHCVRCACDFVPGEYRVLYWLDAHDEDVEAVAYCPTCDVGILRTRPRTR